MKNIIYFIIFAVMEAKLGKSIGNLIFYRNAIERIIKNTQSNQ